MKTPEELLREFADNPAGLAQYAAQLQQDLVLKAQQLAEAQAIIADLKRAQ
jgi:hypothetical protein